MLTMVVDGGLSPRAAGKVLGVPEKRVMRWCEKWDDRWDYDWGICIDLGWFPEERKDEVRCWIEARWSEVTFQPDEVVLTALEQGARSCEHCNQERDLHDTHSLEVERTKAESTGIYWYLVVCPLHGGWRRSYATTVDVAISNWNRENDALEGRT